MKDQSSLQSQEGTSLNPKYNRYYTYIRPLVRNKAVQTYSPFVFSIVTVMVLAFFAIRPTVGTIIGLQKSITEQTQIRDTLNTKSANLSEGKRNYQELSPEVQEKLALLLPDQTSLPDLINDLSSLTNNLEASISGLQVQPVEIIGLPNTPIKDAKLTEISFTYNVVGGYRTFNEILRRIQFSNRLIALDSVNITRATDESLVMSINAKSYFLKN